MLNDECDVQAGDLGLAMGSVNLTWRLAIKVQKSKAKYHSRSVESRGRGNYII